MSRLLVHGWRSDVKTTAIGSRAECGQSTRTDLCPVMVVEGHSSGMVLVNFVSPYPCNPPVASHQTLDFITASASVVSLSILDTIDRRCMSIDMSCALLF